MELNRLESEMMKSHTLLPGQNTLPSRFKCLKCDKTFLYKIGYNKHIEKHEKVVTKDDPINENSVDTEENGEALKSQETIHPCKICNKSFRTSYQLKIHARSHTGEKPYHCRHCSKQFSISGNLKIHEKIHNGSKLFECKLCEKSFIYPSSLKKHEKSHTSGKLFKCKYCSKKSCLIQNLESRLKFLA